MNRTVIFWIAAILLMTPGCQRHYYKVEKDTLYFYLRHPEEARNVELRCSFDGYKAHPAIKTDNDIWEAAVPFTSEFSYFYVVDGVIVLPPCRLTEKDDFGSANCIFVPDM
jgi:hypothetical protein